MVEENFRSSTDEDRSWYKLVLPALFWLFYVPALLIWAVFMAWIQSRIIIPLYQQSMGQEIQKGTEAEESSSSSSDADSGKEEQPEEIASALALTDGNGMERQVSDESHPEVPKSRSVDLVHNWDKVGCAMNYLVPMPPRFKRIMNVKELNKTQTRVKHVAKPNYVMCMFRSNASFVTLIYDIAPLLCIILNNIWLPVTIQYLQMLNCEAVDTTGKKDVVPDKYLMMDTRQKCDGSGAAGMLSLIAITGLMLWTVGIIAGFFIVIRRNDLQGYFVQRTFGYVLEGYEPRSWWWDISVKKVDLVLVAVICYTSLAADPRTKLLLYMIWSLIMIMIQIAYGPYDNRQIDLLDRVENFGLLVRAGLYCGVAFCLLFGTPPFLSNITAYSIIAATASFVLKVVIHLLDDFVAAQAAKVDRSIAFSWKMRRKVLGKRTIRLEKAIKEAEKDSEQAHRDFVPGQGVDPRVMVQRAKDAHKAVLEEYDEATAACKRQLTGAHVALPPTIAYGKALNTYQRWLTYPQAVFFMHYRFRQYLRFKWRGPTSDASLYRPGMGDGAMLADEDAADAASDNIPFYLQAQLSLPRMFFNLDSDTQLTFAVESIAGFLHLLIFGAQFEQIPARMTDMIMLLALGIKRWTHEMTYDPPLPEKTKKKRKRSEKRAAAAAALLGDKAASVGVKGDDKNSQVNQMDMLEEAEFDDSAAVRRLKAMLIEEILLKLEGEHKERKVLLDQLKPRIAPELQDRSIPEELAWEILERLTTDQLRYMRPNPKVMLLRIRIFQLLLQCEANTEATMKRETTLKRMRRDRLMNQKDRVAAMHLMEHSLRSRLEKEPDLQMDHVTEEMDKLPVEEVRRLTKSPDECIGTLKTQRENDVVVEKSVGFDAVTVEDLNNLLMFIYKVEWRDLKDLLEYAQMLLDFVQLPHTAVWKGNAKRKKKDNMGEDDLAKLALMNAPLPHDERLGQLKALMDEDSNSLQLGGISSSQITTGMQPLLGVTSSGLTGGRGLVGGCGGGMIGMGAFGPGAGGTTQPSAEDMMLADDILRGPELDLDDIDAFPDSRLRGANGELNGGIVPYGAGGASRSGSSSDSFKRGHSGADANFPGGAMQSGIMNQTMSAMSGRPDSRRENIDQLRRQLQP
jgi:hypothetical protein